MIVLMELFGAVVFVALVVAGGRAYYKWYNKAEKAMEKVNEPVRTQETK